MHDQAQRKATPPHAMRLVRVRARARALTRCTSAASSAWDAALTPSPNAMHLCSQLRVGCCGAGAQLGQQRRLPRDRVRARARG
eukprot:scaffold60535_cov32-Phaeocystis_antarctica.AAC.1